MPYLDEICEPLLKVLRHTAGLPVHQLAGHAANLDFWVSEAVHRLAVIDGYQRRFEALRSTQEAYEREHGLAPRSLPLARSTRDEARKEVRRQIVEAVARLISQCKNAGILDAHRANVLLDQLCGESERALAGLSSSSRK